MEQTSVSLFSPIPRHPNSLFPLLSQAQGKQVYLLFDQVQFTQGREFWDTMKNRRDVDWYYLLSGTPLAYLEEGSPVLISVSDGNPGETLYYWLCEHLEAPERFGFIGVYDGSLAEVQRHWQNWVYFWDKNQRSMMLRFYDIAAFPLWYDILTPAQKQKFKGKHESIAFCQRSDAIDLSLFQWPELPYEDDPQAASVYPVQLTAAQHEQFFYPQRIESLVDELFRRLAPDYAWLLPQSMVRLRFHEGLALARQRYNLATSLERETYALYRFYIADRFDEHPEFIRLMSFYSLRDAIGHFYDFYLTHQEDMSAYRTAGWLGIEGKARLIP